MDQLGKEKLIILFFQWYVLYTELEEELTTDRKILRFEHDNVENAWRIVTPRGYYLLYDNEFEKHLTTYLTTSWLTTGWVKGLKTTLETPAGKKLAECFTADKSGNITIDEDKERDFLNHVFEVKETVNENGEKTKKCISYAEMRAKKG